VKQKCDAENARAKEDFKRYVEEHERQKRILVKELEELKATVELQKSQLTQEVTNALLQLRQLKAQWESNKAFKEMAEAVLGKEMFQKFSGDQISRIGTRLSDIRELNTKSRHKFYNFVGKLLNEVLETAVEGKTVDVHEMLKVISECRGNEGNLISEGLAGIAASEKTGLDQESLIVAYKKMIKSNEKVFKKKTLC
jgi:polyribonucleotide nucleotidyltransferase